MITKDMLIIDILRLGKTEEEQQKLADILMESGMHCLHCMLAHGETLEEAAAAHGVNADELATKLSAAL
jgi:hybrid cluster-associated redox disulfide protein